MIRPNCIGGDNLFGLCGWLWKSELIKSYINTSVFSYFTDMPCQVVPCIYLLQSVFLFLCYLSGICSLFASSLFSRTITTKTTPAIRERASSRRSYPVSNPVNDGAAVLFEDRSLSRPWFWCLCKTSPLGRRRGIFSIRPPLGKRAIAFILFFIESERQRRRTAYILLMGVKYQVLNSYSTHQRHTLMEFYLRRWRVNQKPAKIVLDETTSGLKIRGTYYEYHEDMINHKYMLVDQIVTSAHKRSNINIFICNGSISGLKITEYCVSSFIHKDIPLTASAWLISHL